MKASTIIVVIITVLVQLAAFGQDTIYVSHNKTTAIQFPVAINGPISSNADLIAVTKGNYTLALKATGTNFRQTKFSVKTLDGSSYNFPVAFSYGRAGRFEIISSNALNVPSPRKLSTSDLAERMAGNHKIGSIASDRHHSVKSQIGDITILGDNLFYKLKLKNRSNINFDVDFIRFYVRDLKTAKRTVTQEKEIIPITSHGTSDSTIEGNSSVVYVFALPKFPLSSDKALFVEVYERNGARHQYLKVKRSDVDKASSVDHKE